MSMTHENGVLNPEFQESLAEFVQHGQQVGRGGSAGREVERGLWEVLQRLGHLALQTFRLTLVAEHS